MLDLVQKVFAADTEAVSTSIANPLSDTFGSVGDIFGFAVNLLVGIGWGLVFIMLALGFMRYVMSKGEKIETQGAQQQLTYAVIGGIGLLLIGVIKSIVEGLLGAEISGGGGNIIPTFGGDE